jgi:hypothetical protein
VIVISRSKIDSSCMDIFGRVGIDWSGMVMDWGDEQASLLETSV